MADTVPFRILIVDDDPCTLDLLAKICHLCKYETVLCKDAEAGLDAYAQETFPLIIADWVLPRMNGLDFCRAIRRLPQSESSVILMCTAKSEPGALQECLDAGADDYLAKPFDFHILKMRLQIAKQRARLREERKQILKTQQRVQRLESLSVLAGGIAHDYNNILTVIIGNTDLALQTASEGTSLHKRLSKIKTASQRALELTHQMLAYTGKSQFARTPQNLQRVISDITQSVNSHIGPNMTLSVESEPDLPLIQGHTEYLQQMISNLIFNAIESLPSGAGNIHIRTGKIKADRAYLSSTFLDDNLPEGNYVYLDVNDSGCGMDDVMKTRIFDPFYSTKFPGRGLGLAAVLGIVRSHHGTIHVDSHLGRGSSFRVLLPVDEEMTAKRSNASAQKVTTQILIVDDDEMITDLLRMMLENEGYQVLHAHKISEASTLYLDAHSSLVQLIILDVNMPEGSGLDYLKKLRISHPKLPVILTSGYLAQDFKVHCDSRTIFLQKPFVRSQLVESVNLALASNGI
jgi:DNA-binding response OmpR family regulator